MTAVVWGPASFGSSPCRACSAQVGGRRPGPGCDRGTGFSAGDRAAARGRIRREGELSRLARAHSPASAARRPVVGARRKRRRSAPMSEPRTVRVKDGGFVSLERGPDEKDWTRLEVATADPDRGARRHPDVGLGGRARSSAATAGGRSGALRGRPRPWRSPGRIRAAATVRATGCGWAVNLRDHGTGGYGAVARATSPATPLGPGHLHGGGRGARLVGSDARSRIRQRTSGGASPCPWYSAFAGPKPCLRLERTMKIISWNIAHRSQCWKRLLETDADVALLQEAAEPPPGDRRTCRSESRTLVYGQRTTALARVHGARRW